jgi:hypothetical protein
MNAKTWLVATGLVLAGALLIGLSFRTGTVTCATGSAADLFTSCVAR